MNSQLPKSWEKIEGKNLNMLEFHRAILSSYTRGTGCHVLLLEPNSI